jgi:hypothetical protein
MGDSWQKLSPEMRLSEFLPVYVARRDLRRSEKRPLTAATRNSLAGAVRRWIEYTGDPPLRAIPDGGYCDDFLGGLMARGIARETIRKECRQIQSLLDLAGPRGPGNKHGPVEFGLFGSDQGRTRSAPAIDIPFPEGHAEKSFWSSADADAFRAACCWARRPRLQNCPAAVWWLAAIDVVQGTGIRRRTLLALQRDWLDVDRRLLDLPGSAVKSGRRTVIYASRLVREAIARMPVGFSDKTVFPWPYTVGLIHVEFRRILSFSMVPQAKREKAGFHCLRRGLGDQLAARDRQTAQGALGHADWTTTREHYTQAATQALATGPALEQLAEEILARR